LLFHHHHFFLYPDGHVGFRAKTFIVFLPFTHVIETFVADFCGEVDVLGRTGFLIALFFLASAREKLEGSFSVFLVVFLTVFLTDFLEPVDFLRQQSLPAFVLN
jgi:hypothetical protein